jgi:hypothetical protein
MIAIRRELRGDIPSGWDYYEQGESALLAGRSHFKDIGDILDHCAAHNLALITKATYWPGVFLLVPANLHNDELNTSRLEAGKCWELLTDGEDEE